MQDIKADLIALQYRFVWIVLKHFKQPAAVGSQDDLMTFDLLTLGLQGHITTQLSVKHVDETLHVFAVKLALENTSSEKDMKMIARIYAIFTNLINNIDRQGL